MTVNGDVRLGDFLAKFFGEGNDLKWRDVEGRNTPLAECAHKWVDSYRTRRRWLILPKLSGTKLSWYGIALSDTDSRDLKEQLTAFVGPSLSTFRGESSSLSMDDIAEASIAGFIGSNNRVFKFTSGVDDSQHVTLIRALGLMCRVNTDAETRSFEPQLATGRVLRDFYTALAARNRKEADEALEYLGRHQRLDAVNLLFLQVQLLSELGLWRDILSMRAFSDLVVARRPRPVSRALIQAVYRVHLAGFETDSDLTEACRVFREELFPQFAPLYSARMGLTEPDVLKSFMLLAVTAVPQRADLSEEILRVTDVPSADLSYLRRLAQLIAQNGRTTAVRASSSSQADILTSIREAFERGDLDVAMGLAPQLASPVDRAKIWLECAFEIGTIESEGLALSTVNSLSASERDSLFKSRKYSRFYEEFVGPQGAVVSAKDRRAETPTGWLEWLNAVPDSSVSTERIVGLAQKGVDEWPVDTFLQTPDLANQFNHLLDLVTKSDTGRDRLQEALPNLLRFLQRDPDFPRPEFRSIYETLRMEHVYSCRGSESDFAVFGELCEAMMELGASSVEYGNLVEEARSLWRSYASPSNLRSALDILDRLVYYACPPGCEGQRLEFGSAVCSKAASWVRSGRVDPEGQRFLRQLAAELDLTPLMAEMAKADGTAVEAARDPLGSLSGILVIHTLTERVANRVRDILKTRSPRCRVEINSDKVGTLRLRELARKADVFVMVTGSAKHAATTFIEQCRKDKPILTPTGRGTSSIIRELLAHLGATD